VSEWTNIVNTADLKNAPNANLYGFAEVVPLLLMVQHTTFTQQTLNVGKW
jgi:hypothetical protein